jgi:hypothetical protein
VVGVTGDLIARYLAELGASLRTPPERTAEIVAEAEDHLRSSAAVGENLGLTERDAQQAAIAAFGPVRDIVRAHRRPASAVLAEVGTAAMRLAGVYLLAISYTGLGLLILRKLLLDTVVPPHGMVIVAPVDAAPTIVALAACVAGGLTLRAGYRRAVRRARGARWPGDGTPAGSLGGYFPLVAAVSMLAAAPFVISALHALRFLGAGSQWAPGLSVAVLYATVAVAAGYTAAMLRLLTRRRAGTVEERIPDAG